MIIYYFLFPPCIIFVLYYLREFNSHFPYLNQNDIGQIQIKVNVLTALKVEIGDKNIF